VLSTAFGVLFFGGELFLAHKAEGALEIFGDIFPLGAGSDAALGIALKFVVFPTANIADMLHIINPPVNYLLELLFSFLCSFIITDSVFNVSDNVTGDRV
jgi:hypothetical protein